MREPRTGVFPFASSASSTSFTSYFYPQLLTSRIRRKLLKTNDGGASYPQVKPEVDRHKNDGVKIAHWMYTSRRLGVS